METTYRIKLVTSIKDKDLTEALNIYLHTVDENSETSTSQIRDYIQNKYDDNRKMFFYILYVNDIVVGFAEYGYLPQSEILLIDYICTNPRNHTYFYNFYHMLFEDISTILKKKNYFIKYIITELSLKKDNENKYIDVDSNYFRQLLTMEDFKILRTPYYQPYFNIKHELSIMEFNIAIKPLLNGLFPKTILDENFYYEVMTDIYMNHYASWYEKYMNPEQVNSFFSNLLKRLKKEFTGKIQIDNITLVNCVLFQNGMCQQISTENITLKKKRRYYIKQWGSLILCLLFSVLTAVFCYLKIFDHAVTFICSLFTILSSLIALGDYIKEHFFSK